MDACQRPSVVVVGGPTVWLPRCARNGDLYANGVPNVCDCARGAARARAHCRPRWHSRADWRRAGAHPWHVRATALLLLCCCCCGCRIYACQALIRAVGADDAKVYAAPGERLSDAFALLMHQRIAGLLVGKRGSRIRKLQVVSGAKIQVSKYALPQSTECTVRPHLRWPMTRIHSCTIGYCLVFF